MAEEHGPSRTRFGTATKLSLRSNALHVATACAPKYRDRIIVHSFPDFGDDAAALVTELRRRGHVPSVLLDTPDSRPAQVPVFRACRVVYKNSVQGWWHYLTASVIFTTHGPYRRHTPSRRQTVVNLWHGELGKLVGAWLGEDPAVRSTWATSMSNVGKAFMCGEFGIHPNQVLVTGAPRNDRMLTADRSTSRKTLAGDGVGEVIVWMPTYRGRGPSKRHGKIDGAQYPGLVPLSEPDVEELDRWLFDRNALLLVKPHPSASQSTSPPYRNIRLIDQDSLTAHGLSTSNLLASADVLVTDASSVWVDFLLFDRPIVFMFPDIDAYEVNRGLYLQPYAAWVPGPIIRSGADLIATLNGCLSSEDDGYRDARRLSALRFHRHTDAQSTARLLDELGL
jgi:CDP-glycerol glycerophosphotransferase